MCVVVTIDGPAGVGKTTAARQLAARLGFRHLDTGALYRALTWHVMDRGGPLDDAERAAALLRDSGLDLADADEGVRVRIGGRDVTALVRDPEVTRNIHYVADAPEVRRQMLPIQRRLAQGRNVVAEGRDQGTVVFPDAQVKFYLDASLPERARRRLRELAAKGAGADEAEVLAEMRQRDRRDSGRSVGPLKKAEDALLIDTTELSAEQVLETMLAHCRRILGADVGGASRKG